MKEGLKPPAITRYIKRPGTAVRNYLDKKKVPKHTTMLGRPFKVSPTDNRALLRVDSKERYNAKQLLYAIALNASVRNSRCVLNMAEI